MRGGLGSAPGNKALAPVMSAAWRRLPTDPERNQTLLSLAIIVHQAPSHEGMWQYRPCHKILLSPAASAHHLFFASYVYCSLKLHPCSKTSHSNFALTLRTQTSAPDTKCRVLEVHPCCNMLALSKCSHCLNARTARWGHIAGLGACRIHCLFDPSRPPLTLRPPP